MSYAHFTMAKVSSSARHAAELPVLESSIRQPEGPWLLRFFMMWPANRGLAIPDLSCEGYGYDIIVIIWWDCELEIPDWELQYKPPFPSPVYKSKHLRWEEETVRWEVSNFGSLHDFNWHWKKTLISLGIYLDERTICFMCDIISVWKKTELSFLHLFMQIKYLEWNITL